MGDRKIKPAFHTKDYYVKDTIAIRDRYQQYLYIKNNAYPIDIFIDSRDNLVMVFMKAETKDLYEKYRRYELR